MVVCWRVNGCGRLALEVIIRRWSLRFKSSLRVLKSWREICGRVASEKDWRFLPNRLGIRAGSAKEQFSRMEKGLEVSRVGVGILIRISETTS
ncbi:hypothetical protein MRB53_023115 [Persea americana]|uniref:Uncharacterized protein n=1 Tax=Persea americana TaxID=3435 RepID=A0ACC2L9M0_PERAE|nr:hypothetical protein MRB53_023115 [Persea americana]